MTRYLRSDLLALTGTSRFDDWAATFGNVTQKNKINLLRRITMKKNCSATTLKLLAIIAMTVDHIALTFVPQESWLHYIIRLFGRLTAPIMAFFIAEGFRYTRSRKKYLLRLAVFGLISQPFYYLLFYGSFSVIGILLHWNVMVSLLAAYVYADY